jgi:hypothetical protein
MPFVTRCPYCRARAQAPDRAMLSAAKCPKCQSWYTATPDTDPDPPPVSARPARPAPPPAAPVAVAERPPAPAAAPTTDTAVAAATGTAPDLPPVPAPVEAVAPAVAVPPPEPEPARPHPLGVVACLCAGAALVAAAVPAGVGLTRPLAGVAAALGLGGWLATAGGRAARQVLPAVGAAAGALTLLVSFAAPSLLGLRYEASRQVPDYDPDAVTVVPLRVGPDAGSALKVDGYADASRAAVQQGHVRVQVAGAAVGPVELAGAKKRATKRPYLAVTVRVQNLGHGGRVPFAHWGTAAADRAVPPAAATAAGAPLAAADLAPDAPANLTLRYDLFPGEAVADVLLFEPPAGPGPIRLELPAEAWGGRGAFRFEIPAPMIVARSPKKTK